MYATSITQSDPFYGRTHNHLKYLSIRYNFIILSRIIHKFKTSIFSHNADELDLVNFNF